MKAIVDNKTMRKSHLIVVVSTIALFAFAGIAGAMPEVEDVVGQLQQIVADNPDTPLADKAEDVLSKAETALDELAKTPPDYQAAVGSIEGAIGDLEAAVADGLIPPDQGKQMMNLLTCAAWRLGAGAIYQAIDCQADADKIDDAEAALEEGDQLWLDGMYKDAVNKYKDALAKAEGAVSSSIDPLTELVTQDLENADGEDVGKALLCYDENANKTCIRVHCWFLEADTEYTVLLCVYDDDGNATDIELGSIATDTKGKGHLHACIQGDKSDGAVVIGTLTPGGDITPCGVPSDEEYEALIRELYPEIDDQTIFLLIS